MKSLTFKIIIPLSIISFAIITKWWYALPEDAPDTMFTGFPFPFVCNGWHTSLSLQFFVTEFILDIFTYFLFWFVFFYCINRFVKTIKTFKAVTIILWCFCGVIISFAALISTNNDNLFFVIRPFKMEVMETGFQFSWQNIERPDYYKYHPERKPK